MVKSPETKLLLKELKTIATAIKAGTDELASWRAAQTKSEPSADVALALLDYLVIRELTGRQDSRDPQTVVAVERLPGSCLKIPKLPRKAVKLIALTKAGKSHEVNLTPIAGTTNEFALGISDKQLITRLEFQRADGYPLAVGPRLQPM